MSLLLFESAALNIDVGSCSSSSDDDDDERWTLGRRGSTRDLGHAAVCAAVRVKIPPVPDRPGLELSAWRKLFATRWISPRVANSDAFASIALAASTWDDDDEDGVFVRSVGSRRR
ncbi:unnamed protein product [Lampetra planeri]